MNDTTTHSATDVCSECRHWNHQAGSPAGECRRYAPQTLVFTVDEETRFESRFPITNASDWCGEFERK